jgi:hypothetical protein
MKTEARQYTLLLLAVGAALSLGGVIGFTARVSPIHGPVFEGMRSEPWFTLTRLLGLGIALRCLKRYSVSS